MPVAEPVIVDAHTLEVSGVPPNVAALRFQARLDILQFYHFLWEQWQSHVRPQFVHHVTSILLTELLNFEVLSQRSAKSFLGNTDVEKSTSASFQDENLGLLVPASWQLGGSVQKFLMDR